MTVRIEVRTLAPKLLQNCYKIMLEIMERIFDTSITIGTIRNYRIVRLKGVMPAGTGMAKYQYIISGDNTMTQFNYNNKRQKLARILILCGLTQGFEACSTHISMTEGVNFLVGETAHKAFNERAKINHIYKNSYESLDREALQSKLDKEV